MSREEAGAPAVYKSNEIVPLRKELALKRELNTYKDYVQVGVALVGEKRIKSHYLIFPRDYDSKLISVRDFDSGPRTKLFGVDTLYDCACLLRPSARGLEQFHGFLFEGFGRSEALRYGLITPALELIIGAKTSRTYFTYGTYPELVESVNFSFGQISSVTLKVLVEHYYPDLKSLVTKQGLFTLRVPHHFVYTDRHDLSDPIFYIIHNWWRFDD